MIGSDYTGVLGGHVKGYVTLYNAEKKAISATEYINNIGNTSSDPCARAYYMVEKGTYYIRVSTSTMPYIVGYSLVDTKDASGASKAKAAKLTIGGKAKQGMVLASDSEQKTDWYKLTLKKKKKLRIVVDAYVSGRLAMELCGDDSKGRFYWGGVKILKTEHAQLITKEKLQKGTYYIKVTKIDNESFGYYEIKVNT